MSMSMFKKPLELSTKHVPQLQLAGLQETWIYMPKGRVLRQDDLVRDSLKATASKKLDDTMMKALTGEEGPLACGALPAVKAASIEGQKAVLRALDEDGKAVEKVKKANKRKAEDPEEVHPKTILE